VGKSVCLTLTSHVVEPASRVYGLWTDPWSHVEHRNSDMQVEECFTNSLIITTDDVAVAM
jgi:hypothetical protein